MFYHMFDAAYPPDSAPSGYAAVAGYIGGNTPHVWVLSEWLRFSHIRQLPIWTGYAENQPVEHARQAAAAARARGWRPDANPRRYIALDFETEVDPKWVDAFTQECSTQGYDVITYGSLYYVQQTTRGDIWAAEWGQVPHLPSTGRIEAIQYAANVPFGNTQIDLSVIDQDCWDKLGRGPRH
jgi:hypothetical protein